jgi:hypothetical protein
MRLRYVGLQVVWGRRGMFTDLWVGQLPNGRHHVTKRNTPIHNILSTAPQLSISQKTLGTLPEHGNVMPKHVGTAIINKESDIKLVQHN